MKGAELYGQPSRPRSEGVAAPSSSTLGRQSAILLGPATARAAVWHRSRVGNWRIVICGSAGVPASDSNTSMYPVATQAGPQGFVNSARRYSTISDTWSIEATSFAVWMGSRCTTRHTPVASLKVSVTAAEAPSTTNGSMTS